MAIAVVLAMVILAATAVAQQTKTPAAPTTQQAPATTQPPRPTTQQAPAPATTQQQTTTPPQDTTATTTPPPTTTTAPPTTQETSAQQPPPQSLVQQPTTTPTQGTTEQTVPEGTTQQTVPPATTPKESTPEITSAPTTQGSSTGSTTPATTLKESTPETTTEQTAPQGTTTTEQTTPEHTTQLSASGTTTESSGPTTTTKQPQTQDTTTEKTASEPTAPTITQEHTTLITDPDTGKVAEVRKDEAITDPNTGKEIPVTQVANLETGKVTTVLTDPNTGKNVTIEEPGYCQQDPNASGCQGKETLKKLGLSDALYCGLYPEAPDCTGGRTQSGRAGGNALGNSSIGDLLKNHPQGSNESGQSGLLGGGIGHLTAAPHQGSPEGQPELDGGVAGLLNQRQPQHADQPEQLDRGMGSFFAHLNTNQTEWSALGGGIGSVLFAPQLLVHHGQQQLDRGIGSFFTPQQLGNQGRPLSRLRDAFLALEQHLGSAPGNLLTRQHTDPPGPLSGGMGSIAAQRKQQDPPANYQLVDPVTEQKIPAPTKSQCNGNRTYTVGNAVYTCPAPYEIGNGNLNIKLQPGIPLPGPNDCQDNSSYSVGDSWYICPQYVGQSQNPKGKIDSSITKNQDGGPECGPLTLCERLKQGQTGDIKSQCEDASHDTTHHDYNWSGDPCPTPSVNVDPKKVINGQGCLNDGIVNLLIPKACAATTDQGPTNKTPNGDPHIIVRSEGCQGKITNVEGYGWTGNEVVYIYANGHVVGTAETDPHGYFAAPITVPDGAVTSVDVSNRATRLTPWPGGQENQHLNVGWGHIPGCTDQNSSGTSNGNSSNTGNGNSSQTGDNSGNQTGSGSGSNTDTGQDNGSQTNPDGGNGGDNSQIPVPGYDITDTRAYDIWVWLNNQIKQLTNPPKINLEQSEGYPGNTVKVTGSGWEPGQEVCIEWGPSPCPIADKNGEIGKNPDDPVMIKVPDDAQPGDSTIQANSYDGKGNVITYDTKFKVKENPNYVKKEGDTGTQVGHLICSIAPSWPTCGP